ncbi:Inward rectifier potassium channel 2 [Tetrabaena socialis]|uniref:Inward rectifier potassium channel 2 n=1 Tax=Tetrabaena socialis TaxID=47790 RepID=A0A2J8AFZ4_9CHLO|nr:Inward rectifier potassium channel 2 [Tetrabaena socialis]|eukprot:PNH11441.1 Inward rectifier potassium channel 2 [Tetrabaena socialis]
MQGLQEWLLSNSRRQDLEEQEQDEETAAIRRRMRTEKWTLDRGGGYYATERVKKKFPCLVQTGKHAGQSRVKYVGVDFQTFWKHVLRRDFFTTALNAKLVQLVGLLVLWYYMMLVSWASFYYIIWRFNNSCFIGFHGFRSAFMYATETQQTIGYGERATGECWIAALAVAFHSLQAVLLDSVILGIVFSRISHPKQRSRTVLITDCACIARRDGQLKFYPVTLMHELDPARSPVAHWASQKGVRQDADAEVVVVTRGTLYSKQAVVTRTRVYSVLGDIKRPQGPGAAARGTGRKELGRPQGQRGTGPAAAAVTARQAWGHAFLPVILPGSASAAPGGSSKFGAAVDWSRFHATAPINMPPLHDMASPRAGVASPRVSFVNDQRSTVNEIALASAGSGNLSGGNSGTGTGMLAAAGPAEGGGRPPSGIRIGPGLASLEYVLAEQRFSTAGWFVGDKPTLADFAAFDLVDLHLVQWEQQVRDRLPALSAHHSRVAGLAGVAEYLASASRHPTIWAGEWMRQHGLVPGGA